MAAACNFYQDLFLHYIHSSTEQFYSSVELFVFIWLTYCPILQSFCLWNKLMKNLGRRCGSSSGDGVDDGFFHWYQRVLRSTSTQPCDIAGCCFCALFAGGENNTESMSRFQYWRQSFAQEISFPSEYCIGHSCCNERLQLLIHFPTEYSTARPPPQRL